MSCCAITCPALRCWLSSRLGRETVAERGRASDTPPCISPLPGKFTTLSQSRQFCVTKMFFPTHTVNPQIDLIDWKPPVCFEIQSGSADRCFTDRKLRTAKPELTLLSVARSMRPCCSMHATWWIHGMKPSVRAPLSSSCKGTGICRSCPLETAQPDRGRVPVPPERASNVSHIWCVENATPQERTPPPTDNTSRRSMRSMSSASHTHSHTHTVCASTLDSPHSAQILSVSTRRTLDS